MELYPTLTVDVCVPLGTDGAPLATAADIMLSFPYPTEKSAVQGMVRVLATHYGFTLLTIRFPPEETLGRPEPTQGSDYYFPERGSDKAWIEAISRAQRRFGFPKRNVFASGRSGGGSSAHQFVEAHPNLVDGYHSEAGRFFVAHPVFTGPVLVTFGEGDRVDANNHTVIAAMTAMGNVPWVFPFHTDQSMRERDHTNKRHCISEPAAACAWAWLAGLADVRLDNKGILPPRSRWSNTNGLPSKYCAELAEKVAPASEELPGNSGWIVRPAGTPRAVIALSWRDFVVNPDELWMDGHLLSDQGFLAVVGADSGDAILTTARRLADKGHLPLVTLVTDVDAKALKETATFKPDCLILIKPRLSLSAAWKAPRIPSILYPSESSRATWEPLAGDTVSVATLPIGAANPGAWHVRLLRDIVKRLDVIFPAAQRPQK